MSDAFLSSDDFDEQAHHLYNEGRYDDALSVLNEGIALYPHAVELHIGRAYAHLAREEYAWSRRSFEQALALDPDHEDGLAGLGETLLKLGDRAGAMRAVERILQLGFQDDHELMLQIGRALFREGLIAPAHRFFDLAAAAHPESPDAAACPPPAAPRPGALPRLRGPPAGQRCRRALLASSSPRDRRRLQRGTDLPRQSA